jgi:hypothetical protein
MQPPSVAWLLLSVCLAAGCGSHGNGGLLGEVGTYGADAGSFEPGDAGVTGPLDAHVEHDGVAVTFLTLSCSGDCAEVVAVATGGNPPYSFAWEDGSTSAQRRVCPSSTTKYRVTATDTGTTGEIARPAATAAASLTAEVLACPDAGSGGACLSNPSFEGTPSFTAMTNFGAPPWVSCVYQGTTLNTSGAVVLNPSVIPDAGLAPGFTPLVPTDGNTYASLQGGGITATLGNVSEPLCAPMHAGSTYALELDMASQLADSFSAYAALQIWGSTSSCAQSELLWTSPVGGPGWKTYCATLAPTHETTYITLVPTSSADYWVDVDHLVPEAACP